MMDLLALLALAGLAIALLLAIALPIVLAAALVVALLKLVFFVILLPFRILGVGIKAIGFALKGTLLLGAFALLFLVGLVPLVPLVLLGVVLYLLLRPSRALRATPGS